MANRLLRTLAAMVLALAGALASHAYVAPSQAAGGAAGLRERYAELRAPLERNAFGRPVFLDSREKGNDLEGDVFAVVDHSFPRVLAALRDSAGWCDILMLPHNSKHCEHSPRSLTLYVGRKTDTPIKDAYRLDFRYAIAAASNDYLQIVLTSALGPLGTRDYRIVLEATPLEGGRTFMRLGYTYGYGTVSRLAMQTYLATLGRNKVGFSTAPEGGLVRGMRGVMERNTMRFFLAIEAHLVSHSVPPPQRLQKRLDYWFTETERYPRQLHEMDREEYLSLKHGEMRRLASAGQ